MAEDEADAVVRVGFDRVAGTFDGLLHEVGGEREFRIGELKRCDWQVDGGRRGLPEVLEVAAADCREMAELRRVARQKASGVWVRAVGEGRLA